MIYEGIFCPHILLETLLIFGVFFQEEFCVLVIRFFEILSIVSINESGCSLLRSKEVKNREEELEASKKFSRGCGRFEYANLERVVVFPVYRLIFPTRALEIIHTLFREEWDALKVFGVLVAISPGDFLHKVSIGTLIDKVKYLCFGLVRESLPRYMNM